MEKKHRVKHLQQINTDHGGGRTEQGDSLYVS